MGEKFNSEMMSFKVDLHKKLRKSFFNNFDKENHDEDRFGSLEIVKKKSFEKRLKDVLKRFLNYKLEKQVESKLLSIVDYMDGLESLSGNLNREGQKLLVDLIAYRLLGFRKVKLKRNDREYWKAMRKAETAKVVTDAYDPHFMHFLLYRFQLNKIGMNAELYFNKIGIAIDFILEQYAYKRNGKNFIEAEPGDIVLDVGGCWGDTAIYFSGKVGPFGKVYSFEFIPDNIKLFNINKELNPHLKSQIKLVPFPLFQRSGVKIYFKDNGPGSRIEMEPFDGQSGEITTICIDDFVVQNNIRRVDFIKMDIEGAEIFALEGAEVTIRSFKPKLAIAIYHSMADMVNIPKWIMGLNLGYKLYLAHYTIHAEETVIFAKIEP